MNLNVILKYIGIVIVSCIAIFVIYLGTIIITDYRPDEKIKLDVTNNKDNMVKLNDPISITTFNIGYCGLDKNQNFFMDGGTDSRSSSQKQTVKNINDISNYLKEKNSSFYFIQEIDKKATRSFYVNEYDYLKKKLKNYSDTFAYNYKVLWVPVPIKKPHGFVRAGLATFSKYKIDESTRYQLPGKETFLRQLMLLDRCFIESRIPIENSSKELVLINTHLSTFDKGGNIRKQQLAYLKKYIESEYKKGNYIVVGGDWNHKLGETNFKTKENIPDWTVSLPSDFKPQNFNWGVDSSTPTVRSGKEAYRKGITYVDLIDGFLLSDNIKIMKTQGDNLDFENTDHNPVTIEFELK